MVGISVSGSSFLVAAWSHIKEMSCGMSSAVDVMLEVGADPGCKVNFKRMK